MDGEEKGETDQRARDERKYRTGQVRWTQMMRKREMCTGEDTGELEESREGREGTEGTEARVGAPCRLLFADAQPALCVQPAL